MGQVRRLADEIKTSCHFGYQKGINEQTPDIRNYACSGHLPVMNLEGIVTVSGIGFIKKFGRNFLRSTDRREIRTTDAENFSGIESL